MIAELDSAMENHAIMNEFMVLSLNFVVMVGLFLLALDYLCIQLSINLEYHHLHPLIPLLLLEDVDLPVYDSIGTELISYIVFLFPL